MITPNTLTLLQTLLDAFTAHMTAPLAARIDELEKRPILSSEAFDSAVIEVLRDQPAACVDFIEDEIKRRVPSVEPTPEFIEKVRDAVLADSAFDDAVYEVISNRSSDLASEMEDDIKSMTDDNLEDRVAEVIGGGSFSVEFTR